MKRRNTLIAVIIVAISALIIVIIAMCSIIVHSETSFKLGNNQTLKTHSSSLNYKTIQGSNSIYIDNKKDNGQYTLTAYKDFDAFSARILHYAKKDESSKMYSGFTEDFSYMFTEFTDVPADNFGVIQPEGCKSYLCIYSDSEPYLDKDTFVDILSKIKFKTCDSNGDVIKNKSVDTSWFENVKELFKQKGVVQIEEQPGKEKEEEVSTEETDTSAVIQSEAESTAATTESTEAESTESTDSEANHITNGTLVPGFYEFHSDMAGYAAPCCIATIGTSKVTYYSGDFSDAHLYSIDKDGTGKSVTKDVDDLSFVKIEGDSCVVLYRGSGYFTDEAEGYPEYAEPSSEQTQSTETVQ